MGLSPECVVVVVRMAEAGAGADEIAANRELWTRANSEYTDEHAYRAWAAEDEHVPLRDRTGAGECLGAAHGCQTA